MIRRNALFLLTGLFILSLGLTGCDTFNVGNDELTDLNENPNASTEPSVDALIANGQRDIAFAWFGADPTMRGANLLAQYTTQNQYSSNSIMSEDPRVGQFVDYYNPLNDLEQAKSLVRQREQTTPGGQNSIAVAMIHQAWTFQIVTDIYGSVPLADALQGPNEPSPAYSPQSEIYPALIDSLNTALGLINTGASGPNGDLVYDGDIAKWEKFANALKMRIGMRMSDANESAARSAVESAAGNAFQSNADNAYFQFSTSSQHRSTIFENREIDGRNDFDVADRFVNILTENYSTVDPRTPVYVDEARANPNKRFNGFPTHLAPSDAAGLKAQNVNDFFSKPGDIFLKPDVAAPMMLYDEVRFILAEAAQQGWDVPGTARQHFEAAVRASINNWDSQDSDHSVSQSQVDSYVSAVMSDLSNSEFDQVLGEQKWIALYFQGIQGWSEWRRLDFEGHIREPEGGFAAPNGGLTLWAMRVDYPDGEFSVNDENVSAAIQQQQDDLDGFTGNHFGSRLWWDVNQPPAEVRQ